MEFQSSLPRGERLVEIEFVPVHLEFQSSLPRGERQTLRSISHSDTGFQSSLPRGERPKGVLFYGKVPISILAPTRGATMDCNKSSLVRVISILAPTRGATNINLCTIYKLIFQSSLPRGERRSNGSICLTDTGIHPRSHEGSDSICILQRSMLQISILAPTRGATICE